MKYNETDVIEKATLLFWQRGFQAAGMRDIQQALDMRPGSIYAKFQSKEGLFKKVIEHYTTNSEAKLQRVVSAKSPISALRDFFKEALISPNEQRYMRQCLLVRSIAELDVIGEAANKTVVHGMNKLKNCFVDIVSAAINTGELPRSTPVNFAADWLQNQFVGMRAFAVMNDDVKTVNAMIEKVLLDLKGQWPAEQVH